MGMFLYLGGKMVGRREFGAKDFNAAAHKLRALDCVEFVFNPAEKDKEEGFDTSGMRGTHREMDAAGFDRRRALGWDFAWIVAHSQGMVVLPNWKQSPGAFAEVAVHQACYLPVWDLRGFLHANGDPVLLEEAELPLLREVVASLPEVARQALSAAHNAPAVRGNA